MQRKNRMANFGSLSLKKLKRQPTLKMVLPAFPRNGSGVGPGIPSFLNTVYGTTQ